MAIFSRTKGEATTPREGTTSRSDKMSREERLARLALEIPDLEREQYVEELKRSIWSGEYQPDAESTAKALIEERCQDREQTR